MAAANPRRFYGRSSAYQLNHLEKTIRFTKEALKELCGDESFCESENLSCTIQTGKGTSCGFENVAISALRSLEKNLEAVKYGYNFRDAD